MCIQMCVVHCVQHRHDGVCMCGTLLCVVCIHVLMSVCVYTRKGINFDLRIVPSLMGLTIA